MYSDADLGYHTFYVDEAGSSDDWNHFTEIYTEDESWETLQVSLCGVYPQSSYNDDDELIIPSTRDDCNTFQQNVKPSIGNEGSFCVCTKPPKQSYDGLNWRLSPKSFKEYKEEWMNQKNSNDEDTGSIDDVIEIYQSDVLEGTYRIKKSGTYKLMSDIEFDFNAGDLDNPNDGSSWWPRADQSSEYKGADSTRDEYFMGFFAGITIETKNVILDLNDNEIRMSRPFYYQQRFFSCIALKSVVFNLNQGPGIFGTDPKYAQDVIVKNGKIGLSSHHGIHGQGNKGITISNVHVHSFETHGIQLSDFSDIKLENVEIGPSSDIAYLTGEYSYARFTLQRLERIRNDPDKYIDDVFPFTFSGREDIEINDLNDVIDPLREQMDIAFKYVMNIEQPQYSEEDAIFKKALSTFYNPTGIPYGAVMYGLFLNLYFANVFAIHPSLKHSSGAIINNLKIHDLKHSTVEYLRLDEFSVTPYANPYNAALDARSVLGDAVNAGYYNIPWSTVNYIGDVLTDAHIAMDLCTDDWGEKGLMVIGDEFSGWALGKYQWSTESDYTHPFLGCNGDRMTHSAKGTMGIRIDGVNDITFNNLNIYNLHEYSPIGSFLCTDYWEGNMENFFGTGHFLQNTPYLYGYTGNMVHGIFADFAQITISGESNINDLYSGTGLVYAIASYTSVNIDIYDNLNINNLGAGIELLDVDTSLFDHPYAPSIAKP
eukprot:67300_1